jgi:4-aminobutyrate aminotransferase-like enzyme
MAPGALINTAQRSVTPVTRVTPRRKRISIADRLRHRTGPGTPWGPLLGRNVRSQSLTLKRAKGIRLTVTDGKTEWDVLDASGGAAVISVGHDEPRVKAAEKKLADATGISYAASLSLTAEISVKLADFLLETTDRNMAMVGFYGSGILSPHSQRVHC